MEDTKTEDTKTESTTQKIIKKPTKRRTKVVEKSPVKTSKIKFQIPESLREHFGISSEDLEQIQIFSDLNGQEKIEESRKVIQNFIINADEVPDARFALAVAESETLLKGYATLDDQHRTKI